jgi:hypothetical protein
MVISDDLRMRSSLCLAVLLAVALSGCAERGDTMVGADGRTLPRQPATVTTPPPVTATPAPILRPACRPPGVKIMISRADAASGLRVVTVWLENCGTRPYTVDGYPSLRILDRSGRPTPRIAVYQGLGNVTHVPDYDGPTRRVTLRPHGRVTALIAWRDLVTRTDVNATFGDMFELAATPGDPVHRLTNGGRIDVGNTDKVAVSPWLPVPAPYTPLSTDSSG